MRTSADSEMAVPGLPPSIDADRQISSSSKVRRLTAGIAVISALLLAACGGDDSDDGATQAPVDVTQADGPGAVGGDNTGAVAAFEEWAETLRALGHPISFQSGRDATAQLSELAFGGLDDVEWTAASASIVGVENGTAELRPDGNQELSLQLGARIGIGIAAETVRVRVNDESPDNTQLVFEFVDVTVGSSTMESIVISVAEAGVTIALNNTVLANGMGGPLGDTIASLDVLVTETSMVGASARLTAASMGIRWGLLDLEGTGTLEIDEGGAWSGLIDAKIPDVLAVIDAFRAYETLDRDALADFYAAVIEELPTIEGGIPVVLELDSGTVTLLGETRGLRNLSLGTNIRLLDAVQP